MHGRALAVAARGLDSGCCLVTADVDLVRVLGAVAGQTLRQAPWSGTEERPRLVDSTPFRLHASDVAERMSSTASRSFWDTPQGTGTPWTTAARTGGGGRALMARRAAGAQLLQTARMAPARHHVGPPVIMECCPIKSCFRDVRRMKHTSASRIARYAQCPQGNTRSHRHHEFTTASQSNAYTYITISGHNGAGPLFLEARSSAKRADLAEVHCRHASCSPVRRTSCLRPVQLTTAQVGLLAKRQYTGP